MLVKADVVAVCEIVFRRKSIRRIDEPSRHEHQRDDRDYAAPPAYSAPKSGNADRITETRKHVTRQFRSSHERHGKHISDDHGKHGKLRIQCDPRAFSVFVAQRRQPHGEQCRQSQEQKMKIAEGLPKADKQSQQDSQRLKRTLDVVAKKFRIAENHAGSQIVVDVPAVSGKSGNRGQVEFLKWL